jgi:rare lipoprotein A
MGVSLKLNNEGATRCPDLDLNNSRNLIRLAHLIGIPKGMTSMKHLLCFSLSAVFFLSGCASDPRPKKPAPDMRIPQEKWVPGARPYEVNGIRYFPLSDAEGFVEYGKASWYGAEFHGRPTASGLVYDMHAKSAAHKTLPLDTVVRVVNLSNQRSVVVPVNDRGPFVRGRVIDLSFAAAKELDMIGPGIAEVRVEALAREGIRPGSEGGSVPLLEWQDFRKGEFTIQIGAFENEAKALALADRFRELFDFVHVDVYRNETGRVFHRVQVSKSTNLDEAEEMERKLAAMGFPNAFVVRM